MEYWDVGLGKTYHEFEREAQEYADRIAEQYKADGCKFDVPIYEKTRY